MRPLFHPNLVNGRYGDPTVYVETLFEKRSLLFDIGEIYSLSPRKIRRSLVPQALRSGSFTSFRPIAGIWSKPIRAILSSL
jgi:hypothetical protein